MKPQPTKPAASQRLLSLDALRGFDMLFIMGFAGLVAALCKLWPGEFSDWTAAQMGHADWNGFFHHDTIFPLFLFIAGISFPFSLAKQREKGMSERSIYLKVIRRGLTLVVLGFVYSGLFKLDFATLRLPSVLGRIGLAWMFAALLFVNFNVRSRAVIAAAILLGYGLLLQFAAAPDAGGAGPLTLEGNIVGYVDRIVMPTHLLGGRGFDPEGLLSTLPAIVTAMLGMFTGEFVRRSEERTSGSRKALWMAAGAVVLLVLALCLDPLQPINKKLWTPAFVFAAGSLLAGHVRSVLLYNRCAAVAAVELFLQGHRRQFDHDLHGPADRPRELHLGVFSSAGWLRNSRPRRPPWSSRRDTSPSAGCCYGSSTGKRYTSKSDRPPTTGRRIRKVRLFSCPETEYDQLSKIIYRISIKIICFSKFVSYVCGVENRKRHPMEIEKVIRILTIFLVVAAFAVKVATHLMFPQSPHGFDLPIVIVLVLCLTNIWRKTDKQEENSNK